MEQFIIAIHVLAAILLIGPVAIASSMYAPAFRKAQSGSAADKGSLVAQANVTRRYGYISALVPVLGLVAFMTVEGAMQNYYMHGAILLALIAWGILVGVVIPRQRLGLIALDALDESDTPASEAEKASLEKVGASKIPGQAAMFGGIFNLLWIVTAILMFL